MAKKQQKLELTWIGKGEEPKLEPRILIENPEYSYGDPHSGNMLIHGDNLLALKALEQEFIGKVKCVYIDPPFNTGAAFEHYEDGLEHSIWLDLMTQRLKILKKLLKKDGVIYVHIDDKEMAYLRIMMDEIFERKNFLNMIVVKTSDPSGHKVVNPSPYSQTEYILMYAKNRQYYSYEIQYVPTEYDPMYNKIVVNIKDPYSKWKIENLNDFYAKSIGYTNVREAKNKIGALDFDKKLSEFAEKHPEQVFQLTAISNAAGRQIVELREKSKDESEIVHHFPREDYDDIYVYNGRQIYFLNNKIKDIDGKMQISKPLTNLWTDIPYNGIAGEGEVIFKNGKKPEKLIKRCIEIASDENDWVLDSFLGSGTTTAVAHKLKRNWIGIELGDHAYSHCHHRMKKVIQGDQGGISKLIGWNGGGGFKFYTLAPSLLNQDNFGNWVISKEYNPTMIAAAVAKQEGFRFFPDEHIYWKQGKSSEKDFIYTTTQFVTVEILDKIKDEMQPDESLLIACKAFQQECENRFSNITIKKIPQMLLGRCEFGKDDYSLNIVNMPLDESYNAEPEETEVNEPEVRYSAQQGTINFTDTDE